VAGRHTDDPLLREAPAAYAELEVAAEVLLDRMRGEGGASLAQRRDERKQQAAADRRYAEAWLRWLDQQADQSG
jgi:hypothetical protein